MNATVRLSDSLDMSASEIAALTWRAARGVGFQWGEADEAAFASTWLCAEGFDWIEILLAVLRNRETCAPVVSAGKWSGPAPLCPLRAGIALGDFAMLPQGLADGELVLEPVSNPAFILPFATRASDMLARPLLVRVGDFEALLTPDMDQPFRVRFRRGAAAVPREPATILISVADKAHGATHADEPARHCGGVSPILHRELSALAMQMTVPTSALSLAGAGAAGDDND
jgi:hypothetical protein